MLEIRRDEEIHEEQGGWFQARWHFSFGGYHDPEQMGIGALRVFNDDRIVAGAEWPMHPHRDIESLTNVVEGEFEHVDSLGNGGHLGPGAAQVMRFSHRGAHHSERNGSDDDPMRFLQFWILPSEEGLESSVQQRQYSEEDRADRWLQIMGPEEEDGLDLAQDARTQVSRLTAGNGLSRRFDEGRGGYLYVIDGAVVLDDEKLATGDAAKVVGPHELDITATDDAELIVIDVPLDFEPVGVWSSRR
ncbi:MAG: pirin family protein [Nitriliruptorales bacterium]|nr:pirin family protein [Nitriliruptorales bacterium]